VMRARDRREGETSLIPRCRWRSAEEKANIGPMVYWLTWEEASAVGDLVHVEKFFGETWEVSPRPGLVTGRLGTGLAAQQA
jgi:hypothetical protein